MSYKIFKVYFQKGFLFIDKIRILTLIKYLFYLLTSDKVGIIALIPLR